MQNISREDNERTIDSGEKEPERIFSDEAIKNILGFLGCVKDIQDRLLREGYRIEGNEFVPPPEKSKQGKQP